MDWTLPKVRYTGRGKCKVGKLDRRGRTFTTIWGMVSVVHGDECLANFLAIGEPRGAWAGAGAASLVGVFSL